MECYEYEKEHIAFLEQAAPECMVLLKSDGHFPLKSPCALALYGSGARNTLKGGTGSGDVNVRRYVTVEEGLKKAGFNITTTSWMDDYEEAREEAHQQFVRNIREQAEAAGVPAILFGMGAVMPEPDYDIPLEGKGDTCIYVLSRISGEGSDRNPVAGDLKLTRTEVRDILTANRLYPNFLLALNVGGVVDLSPVMDVSNILLLSQTGMTVGTSLADVVLGKANPSGKLACTFAAADEYSAIGTFGDRDDTRYREGIYVGYRYFDSIGKEPLFPFGFGLSYTTFTLTDDKTLCKGTEVEVSVDVTNTGRRPGKEVVQLYVSVPDGALDQPYQTLAAFQKTVELQPGETETICLHFDLRSLASFRTDLAQEVLEAGLYILRLGTDSRHTQPVSGIRLDEDVVLRCYEHAGGSPDFEDWCPPKREPEPLMDRSFPVFHMESSEFGPLELVDYENPLLYVDEAALAAAETMTDEELRYLCVGRFQDSGSQSVIGAAGFDVPGAAGETTSKYKDRGIPNLTMADGPAGLRLSRQYGEDDDGKYSIGDAIPAAFVDFMDETTMKLLGLDQKGTTPERHGVIHDQYCSAIPVGFALAQSFNEALVEQCGDLVGDEMERFGVHIWLAPALNIHRSPLCGRNFEYYSEDPLISGKMAAAMTRGVQKHPGCAVSIKHFVGNNQETNRFHSNSIMSERALRDIYLRGFRIAVEESQPYTVMTSYNLLNGVHTSERKDLCDGVLRAEWGFRGVVISDWVTPGFGIGADNKYPYACASKSIEAGNDLMMPGGPNDIEDLKKTDRSALIPCAARVISMAWKLGGGKL